VVKKKKPTLPEKMTMKSKRLYELKRSFVRKSWGGGHVLERLCFARLSKVFAGVIFSIYIYIEWRYREVKLTEAFREINSKIYQIILKF
jgi:hypothetical protein